MLSFQNYINIHKINIHFVSSKYVYMVGVELAHLHFLYAGATTFTFIYIGTITFNFIYTEISHLHSFKLELLHLHFWRQIHLVFPSYLITFTFFYVQPTCGLQSGPIFMEPSCLLYPVFLHALAMQSSAAQPAEQYSPFPDARFSFH